MNSLISILLQSHKVEKNGDNSVNVTLLSVLSHYKHLQSKIAQSTSSVAQKGQNVRVTKGANKRRGRK